LGYEFKDQIDDKYYIYDRRSDTTLEYQLLNICEFTSTRKRMSCIFRNIQTNEIELMTKGADSVIEALLTQESLDSEEFQTTKKNVD
jgi:phospholipid-transporting ATPase